MFIQNIRRNKESILYFIISILCLEYVRIRYNKLEDLARAENWPGQRLRNKQKNLIYEAGMVYGVPILFLVLNFSTSLTEKITGVYSNAAFLRSNIALTINIVLSYIFSVMIVSILLRQYIKRMNSLTKFWKTLGLSAWDGTKIVLRTPGRIGGAVKNSVYNGTKKGVGHIKRAGMSGARLAGRGARNISKKTLKTAEHVGKNIRGIAKRVIKRLSKVKV